jgi:hypothetical protein
MSQQSEECLPESTESESNGAPSARILHLKSRQYDLQKAIQQRAQESVEREAALDQEQRRPKPLKWTIAILIAAIPMVLTLTAVDSFLKVFHKYLGVATETAQKQQEEAEAAAAAAAAAAEAEGPLQTQPGVVMLQPLNVPEQKPAQPQADASQPQQSDSTATSKQ